MEASPAISTYAVCPNCKAKIKSGMFGENRIKPQAQTDFINKYAEKSEDAYCDQCAAQITYNTIRPQLQTLKKSLEARLEQAIKAIPVITLQSPFGWEYEVKGMVSGQSTFGVSSFTESMASISDIFGGQSNSFNSKLKEGEVMCSAQLRKQALDMDANAVLGSDIDYSEVGNEKGRLMICMAGTAVRLKNTSVLGPEVGSQLDSLPTIKDEYAQLLSMTELANSIR